MSLISGRTVANPRFLGDVTDLKWDDRSYLLQMSAAGLTRPRISIQALFL